MPKSQSPDNSLDRPSPFEARQLSPCLPGQGVEPAGLHRYYKWEVLGLLALAYFFHQGDRAIFGVVLPAIKADMGLTDSQLGLVGSVLFLTLAVLMPVAGYVGDVCSKRWVIAGSLVFWSVATVLTGWTTGILGLVVFRSIATAGGESFYAPAACSMIGAYHRRTRALALSVHQAALYVGVMASGFLAGFIAEQWGWRAAFFLFGGFGIPLGAVLALRLRDASPTAADGLGISPAQALSVLFRKPTAVLLTAGFTAIVFVNNAYVVWAPQFIGQKLELSLTVAGGYALFYHHLAALVGVLVGGRLSDVMVPSYPRFRLCLQSSTTLLAAPAILVMALAHSLAVACIAMTVFGLLRGLCESNTQASLFDVIEPRFRASALGVMIMLAFLAGSISPWMLGQMADASSDGQGLSQGFALLSVIYLVGSLSLLAALLFTFRNDRHLERDHG